MKRENIEYPCPACGGWSDDDEVCSICGQMLPAEYAEEGYLIPGFHQMPEADQQKALEKIEQLRKQRKDNPNES